MAFEHASFDNMLRDTVDYLYRWEREARQDFEYYALRQWDQSDIDRMDAKKMPHLIFDRTRPIIDASAGSEVINRHEAQFRGREPELQSGDPQRSEGAKRLYSYCNDRANAVHNISLAFHQSLVCGVGCTNMEMRYDLDPDGIISTTRIPIFEVGWDPVSVDPNLSDARWVIRDRWLEYDEIASFFGKENVDDVIAQSHSQSSASQGFWAKLFMREERQARIAYDVHRYGHFYDERTKRVRLWECQRRETRYVTRAFVPALPGVEGFEQPQDLAVEKGDWAEFKRNTDAQIASYNMNVIRPAGMEPIPPVEYVEDFPSEAFYRSWHAGSSKLKEEEIPTKAFTYQFITCYEDWSQTGERYFFGIMKPMRDPQKYANKFFSHMVHMWSANPKGSLLVEEGLFENKEEALTNYAQADGLMFVKDGSLQTPKPRYHQLDSGVSFRGIETLLQHALNSVSQAAGVNTDYFVGAASDLRRTAGSAIESIKQSNLSVLAAPFDSLKLYREWHALNTLRFIGQYMSPEVAMRVMGEKSSPEIIGAIMDGELDKLYDVDIADAPKTATEQEENFNKLVEAQLFPQLAQLGVALPPSLAKFVPMPSEVTTDLEQSFSDAKEVQDLQAELAKLQTQAQIIQTQMQMQMMMAQMQGAAPMGPGGPGTPPEQGPGGPQGPPQQQGPPPQNGGGPPQEAPPEDMPPA